MSTAKVKQAPAARTAPKAPAAAAKPPAAKSADVTPAAKSEAAPAPMAAEAAPAAKVVEAAPAEVAPVVQVAEVAPVAKAAEVAPVAQAAEFVSEGFEKVAILTTSAQAKAKRAYEDTVGTAKESVDEALKSGATLARGLQDIGKAFLGLTQASIEDGVSASKKIMAAKTLHEVIELQSELTKSNLDRMMAEGARLTEMTAQLYQDALAPIAARVTASVDKLGKTAN